MVQEMMGDYGTRLLIAILGVVIGLACLVGVLWILRGRRGPSPFVRGGKNRQPRLQVLDAAAVDSRRRLVLVRRDNTEHLIMIGGPSDIVIESGIVDISETAAPPKARPATSRPYVPEELALSQVEPPPPAQPMPKPQTRREPQRSQPQSPDPARRTPAPAPVRAPDPLPPANITPVQTSTAPVQASAAHGEAIVAAPIVSPASETTVMPQQRREPALDEAASILNAARQRVFQGPSVPVRTPPPDLAIPAIDAKKTLGSDFEKVLEEEMANNLAAAQGPADHPIPTGQAKPQGATADPSLQNEMARIFGEMSASRDK